MSLTKSFWLALGRIARATLASWHRRIAAILYRIQPIHVHCNIVPQADDKDHAAVQSLPHCLHATFFCKRISVAKRGLLCFAELVGLIIVTITQRIRRVVNLFSILNVQLLNLGQFTASGVETGDDSERLCGVNLKLTARTIERGIAHAVRIDIASVSVCGCNIAVTTLLSATLRIAMADV